MLRHLLYRVFCRLPLPTYPYRMYMHKRKCIFIHIPKNAGSSILKTLGHKGGRDHVEWRHYDGANPRWFSQYKRFAVCRHPLERLYSAYIYALSAGNHSIQDRELKAYIESNSQSFEQFVENVLDQNFIQENVLFKPQYLFIYAADNILMVDVVLRFESLQRDWHDFAVNNTYPTILPEENFTNHTSLSVSDISQQLNQHAKLKINTLFKKDFDLFNYSLDT